MTIHKASVISQKIAKCHYEGVYVHTFLDYFSLFILPILPL